jgi:hypothetical protein
MKTASWKTYTGAGRIGISAGSPRGAPAGYRLYRDLAPDRAWMHQPLAIYQPLYQAILDGLDPQRVWDEIHRLAGVGADGRQIEPVMMCFERPAFTEVNFCHRRLAAIWLGQRLGVRIDEVGFEGRDVDIRQAVLV